jgi:hypothetical protein
MKLLIETIFIGLYTQCIYFLLCILFVQLPIHFKLIKVNLKTQIFIVGFLKHFLGYYTGIQSYYCNHYNNKNGHNIINSHKYALPKNLVVFSLLEGFAFVLIASLLLYFFQLIRVERKYNNIYVILFLVGAILHLLAEITGIHKYFYTNYCS